LSGNLAIDLIKGRDSLFRADLERFEKELQELVSGARFLVIGGAGSIGRAVVGEIFRRRPAAVHAVDLSENNLVELVRDIRSSLGYIEGEFSTLPLDATSPEFDAFLASQPAYDYVLNLSALKHVRSEKDPYTLMRLVQVNIFNTKALAKRAARDHGRKFFCVSTDKAANPVNMMGASKRIMELVLVRASNEIPVSLARFANVAFSDGSLLNGFQMRMQKRQPIAAPRDVQRYFVTEPESGELCLLSCLLASNRELFFPRLDARLRPLSFDVIAREFLLFHGYEPMDCASEEEARRRGAELIAQKRWPCWFFDSDTTGEKDIEEFYTEDEHPDFSRFGSIGVLTLSPDYPAEPLDHFEAVIQSMRKRGSWTKREMLDAFRDLLPGFVHEERGKYLDGKM
jgi:FlaA1/EpsC-like NDP-sugar epimerase